MYVCIYVAFSFSISKEHYDKSNSTHNQPIVFCKIMIIFNITFNTKTFFGRTGKRTQSLKLIKEYTLFFIFFFSTVIKPLVTLKTNVHGTINIVTRHWKILH